MQFLFHKELILTYGPFQRQAPELQYNISSRQIAFRKHCDDAFFLNKVRNLFSMQFSKKVKWSQCRLHIYFCYLLKNNMVYNDDIINFTVTFQKGSVLQPILIPEILSNFLISEFLSKLVLSKRMYLSLKFLNY